MVRLAGIDAVSLGGVIANSIGLEAGVLVKEMEQDDPNDSDKVTTTTIRSNFQGILEFKDVYQAGTLVSRNEQSVLIVTGTLQGGVRPEKGDIIQMRGKNLQIISAAPDPAEASYTCIVG